ncbi:MAG: hypothetical protein V4803_22365 [Burkholderia gladioli]|uniref:hypothetical protein n=1 Tax=Burkholderia gladioli TaxID=28095 RepID=UPI001640408F|nr:hypothetical protein [Burkholderia gladioli]
MKLTTVSINANVSPHGSLFCILSDGQNSIQVNVKLDAHHHIPNLTIHDIEELAKHAAKHLIP